MKNFLKEFKEFATKGNIIDLAVAVVIGGAFGKIITSLVADIIMPLVGLLFGKVNVTTLAWTIQSKTGGEPVLLKYGLFIQNIIDFVIIAFFIFVVIRAINKMKRKKEEEVAPEDTKDQLLLTEIRDLLKEKKEV